MYLLCDCAQTSVKNTTPHAQKILHILHIVWLMDRALRLFSPRGTNGIVFSS